MNMLTSFKTLSKFNWGMFAYAVNNSLKGPTCQNKLTQ